MSVSTPHTPPLSLSPRSYCDALFTDHPTATPSLNTTTESIAQAKQDMLKSRLLTGEFVILSQNFSRNPSQRTLMAERIVKLVSCKSCLPLLLHLLLVSQLTLCLNCKTKQQSDGSGFPFIARREATLLSHRDNKHPVSRLPLHQ